MMHILILGNATDAHAAHLKTALAHEGVAVAYWDTTLFPTRLRLSWEPQTASGAFRLGEAPPLDIHDIHSVFWRTFGSVGAVPLTDAAQQRIASNDAMSAMQTLMKACPARWINSWDAYQFHREKPLQLRTVHDLGVAIPPTLISNDPERVLHFARSHATVIFKPVYGGAHTRYLDHTHLDPARLTLALQAQPP